MVSSPIYAKCQQNCPSLVARYGMGKLSLTRDQTSTHNDRNGPVNFHIVALEFAYAMDNRIFLRFFFFFFLWKLNFCDETIYIAREDDQMEM